MARTGRKPNVRGNVAAGQVCDLLGVERKDYYGWVTRNLLNKAASAGLNEGGTVELGVFAHLKKEFGLEAARGIWSDAREDLKTSFLGTDIRLIVGANGAVLAPGADRFFSAVPLEQSIKVYALDSVIARSRDIFRSLRTEQEQATEPSTSNKPIPLRRRSRQRTSAQ